MNQYDIFIDGFEIVPDMLQDEVIARLITAVESFPGESAYEERAGRRNLLRDAEAVTQLARHPRLKSKVAEILGNQAFAVRALLFDKTPQANWRVGWHQDVTIAVASPSEVPGFTGWSLKQGVHHVHAPTSILENMLTVRLHLDDALENNGPLEVIRASHKQGKLADTEVTAFQENGEVVTCLVPRGGALIMRPLLLHSSKPARTPGHRRVIHLEFAATPLPGNLQWYDTVK